MVETYEAYADYRDVMEMLEQMVAAVAREATGGTTVALEGRARSTSPRPGGGSTSATRCARRAASTCASHADEARAARRDAGGRRSTRPTARPGRSSWTGC